MAALNHDINHLLDMARTKLPGSSDAGIKGELFDVLHEFFNDSRIWTEDINIQVLGDGVTRRYNIIPTAGTIIGLDGVVDGTLLPQPAVLHDFQTIQFQNPYNVTQVFTATVILNVKFPLQRHDIPDIPDWVLTVFTRAILDGVLGKMMSQPKKPYSDKETGAYHLHRFRDQIAMARAAKLRSFTQGTQAWSFPQTWRSRSQKGGISVGNQTGFGI